MLIHGVKGRRGGQLFQAEAIGHRTDVFTHTSRLFQTFPDISIHFQTFPDISRHFQTFPDTQTLPDTSRHFQTLPDTQTLPETFTRLWKYSGMIMSTTLKYSFMSGMGLHHFEFQAYRLRHIASFLEFVTKLPAHLVRPLHSHIHHVET